MDFSVLLVILSVTAAILAITNNVFNIKEKFKKWIQKNNRQKFKSSFIENNPDFEFRTGYISNSAPGVCKLTISIINRSQEIKYINMVSYNFQIPNDNRYLPPCQILRQGQFPKRLENGEPFHIQEDFQNILFNNSYEYWQKNVKVYATCRSTVGDHLRSNFVEYDDLVKRLIPLRVEYENLAHDLAKKFNALNRDIEVSLWQLQHFDRITVHLAKQLQQNNIPVLQFLIQNHGIVWKDNSSWPQIYRELEAKKIPPKILIEYLKNLVEN
jgi:hypothetical protein